jgi:hypothetical protein
VFAVGVVVGVLGASVVVVFVLNALWDVAKKVLGIR